MTSVHAETTLLQGKRIGPYRLQRPLGHGGSAQVYLGTHVQAGHHVAIKIVRRPGSDAAIKQLWNEARILPRLHHPHIVRMLDFYNNETFSFLVMEYALRGTLRQHYTVGTQLPFATVARYVQQVAAALQYTHTFDYIHRDVKPDNLLLTLDGLVQLSDFGIATTAYYADRMHDKFGTAPYTAPEQADGNPCAASDQYSLAIVAYEWLCGHPPFGGTTQEILWQHHMVRPASLASRGRIVPQAVEQVMQKALAKNPLQRFENVLQFSHMLTWALQQPVHPAQDQAVERRRVTMTRTSLKRTTRNTTPPGRSLPQTERTIFSYPPVTQGDRPAKRRQPRFS
jgi:serine/threonine-protein kinase